MQQLAFSPGSRDDGMYVHVCAVVVLEKLHLLSRLSQAIGKDSLFSTLHDPASF